MKNWIIWICLSVAALHNAIAQEKTAFKATSDAIHYVGRTERLDDGSIRFDWVGTHFRFCFTGDKCILRAGDTKSSYYYVFVDGEFAADINIRSRDTLITLCRGVGSGEHTLMAFKRTEASEGATTIYQIILEKDGVLLPQRFDERRRIEFIGNSITCGFGVESNNPYEAYTPETENAYYSYASLTARSFDADYTLIAHSGEGVVHNYGDPKRISDYTMLQRFRSLHDMDRTRTWNFTRWQPQVVVINLGTNDFSQQVRPSSREFIEGYKQLLGEVRSAYGDLPILCLSSPMACEIQYESVRQACFEMNDSNVHFIPILPELMNRERDMGVSFHPNRSGQKKIAIVLTTYLSSIMNWPITHIEQ